MIRGVMLDPEIEMQVYRFVKDNPGSTKVDISKGVGRSVNGVAYDLRRMEADGRMEVVIILKKGYYFDTLKDHSQLKKELIKDAVRSTPVRRRVLAMIKQRPGIGFSELRTQMGISNGSLKNALDKLLDHGIIRSISRDSRIHYFEIDHPVEKEETMSPNVRSVIGTIRKNGQVTQKEIVDATGIPQSTVSRILKRLRRSNEIKTVIGERSFEYKLGK